MTTFVSCTVAEGIADVRLDRPDKLNGLTLQTLRELVEVAMGLADDRSLRGVILSGEGRSFCAGLDFATVLGEPGGIRGAFAADEARGTNLFQEACWVWRRVPVPVVAAVHGHCFGGGLQIALGADLRFTTADARWAVLEAKWGLIPDMSGVLALSQLVRLDVAKRLTFTGEEITGTDAARLGLATEVVDDPVAAAREYLAKVATRSPDSVAAAKRIFDLAYGASERDVLRAERDEQEVILGLPNTAAAQGAAFSGQPPTWGPRAH